MLLPGNKIENLCHSACRDAGFEVSSTLVKYVNKT